MRPKVQFLSNELVKKILFEAKGLLVTHGVEINNPGVLALLGDAGARIDREKSRAFFPEKLINLSLESAPRGFSLYDASGRKTHDLSGDNVYFTPGSTAINILDHRTGEMRKPDSTDYIRYAKLVSKLSHISSQSTAFIPADVPEKISDSYRLYLSLLYCEKPVITGAFTIEAFRVMKDLQIAIRGSENKLREKPLTVFSCCPTAPLKWSKVTSQNAVDCAKYGIPVEYISMPLSGFMAPVTLVGTLVQHTAETLSGVVISQVANPFTPVLWGGSPAIFDVRYETTPMGAPETMMLDCASSEIGKSLGLPTQAYISLSDSKRLDTQAGIESSMGATLAALSGINSVSGPGMLDFESCQSLEKLLVDNEICGMALRLARGIEPHDDFSHGPIFDELLSEGHLLISKHTRKHLHKEHLFPGPTIDRANRSRWKEEGGLSINERAHREVENLIDRWKPPALDSDIKKELSSLMENEARKFGMRTLPSEK